jgi:hypothetical protein
MSTGVSTCQPTPARTAPAGTFRLALTGRGARVEVAAQQEESGEPAGDRRRNVRMTKIQELYADIKPDLGAIAGPLIELSGRFLRERGNFLPHAAVLTQEGKVTLVGAMCNRSDAVADPNYIKPLLRDGLKSMAHETSLRAVGVAEKVTVNQSGGEPVRAIKVMLEHRQGVSVAFYMPFSNEDSGDYVFGKTFSVPANSEINAWDDD